MCRIPHLRIFTALWNWKGHLNPVRIEEQEVFQRGKFMLLSTSSDITDVFICPMLDISCQNYYTLLSLQTLYFLVFIRFKAFNITKNTHAATAQKKHYKMEKETAKGWVTGESQQGTAACHIFSWIKLHSHFCCFLQKCCHLQITCLWAIPFCILHCLFYAVATHEQYCDVNFGSRNYLC